MKDKIIKKVTQIMELSMKLNPTPTQRGLTGCKPTIFVVFSGHVCRLEIDIQTHGWEYDPDGGGYDDLTTEYSLIDLGKDTAYEELENAYKRIKELCEKEGIKIE